MGGMWSKKLMQRFDGGEGGIDSSLRSSPCGRTSCVQIGCADLSNPLVDYRGFEFLKFLNIAWIG
jgi:hypothetical protein